MSYYLVTIREKKRGSNLRRKMAIESIGKEQAKTAFNQKCAPIDFVPDFSTLQEINRHECEKIMASLLGRL